MRPLLFFILLTHISCSHLSKNMSSQGELAIRGGVFENHQWDDNLLFKRASWFKEMTLYFDVIYSRISPTSPFYKWFSNHKKTFINSCKDFVLLGIYELDSRKFSKSDFFRQLKQKGYERFALPDFSSHLKMHPDFTSLSLNLHQLSGVCLSKGDSQSILVNFPGFKEVHLW